MMLQTMLLFALFTGLVLTPAAVFAIALRARPERAPAQAGDVPDGAAPTCPVR